MYAIGGSANPTILSEGNFFTAPNDHNAKEVKKTNKHKAKTIYSLNSNSTIYDINYGVTDYKERNKGKGELEELEMEIFKRYILKWCLFCTIWLWKLCTKLYTFSIICGCSRLYGACYNTQCRSIKLFCWKVMLISRKYRYISINHKFATNEYYVVSYV